MNEGALTNMGDLVVAGVLVFSGLLALWRGFVKEVLSLLGWVGAGVGALYLFPYLRPVARTYIANSFLADAAAAVVPFLVILLVLSYLSSAIAGRVRESHIGTLDRSLGFLFGLARGLVVVALAYMVLLEFVPREEHPNWIRSARSLVLVEYCAHQIASLAPDALSGGTMALERLNDPIARGIGAGTAEALRSTVTPPDSPGETGYKAGERRELDRLIGNTEGNR